jgi:hypothetical protein
MFVNVLDYATLYMYLTMLYPINDLNLNLNLDKIEISSNKAFTLITINIFFLIFEDYDQNSDKEGN